MIGIRPISAATTEPIIGSTIDHTFKIKFNTLPPIPPIKLITRLIMLGIIPMPPNIVLMPPNAVPIIPIIDPIPPPSNVPAPPPITVENILNIPGMPTPIKVDFIQPTPAPTIPPSNSPIILIIPATILPNIAPIFYTPIAAIILLIIKPTVVKHDCIGGPINAIL